MRSDAYINVTCDKCGHNNEYSLCSLAGGGWDAREINGKLRRDNWRTDGETDICESCVEDEANESEQ